MLNKFDNVQALPIEIEELEPIVAPQSDAGFLD